MSLLDFIFPRYCINCRKLGSYLCGSCFSYLSFDTQGICAVCNRPSMTSLTHSRCATKYSIDGVFSSISYKGVAKKLVYNFKYKPYLSDLNNLLVDLFFEGLIQKEEFYNVYQNLKPEPVIVPISLYSSKLRSRGYNQAEILGKGLGQKMNIKVFNYLKRIKNTRSQVGLLKQKRKENISGAFSVVPNILISQYPNIFLVDDVFTTGSTLLEAAKTLKREGAKTVWGLTLARG